MKESIICEIIEKGQIKSVYQPIVSLKDGSVLGYEALARITEANVGVSIEEMFICAEQCQKLWELEYLCRKKALLGIGSMLTDEKIFINVDPYVIYDKRFREGMTQEYLERYGISAQNVVFEITERTDIQAEDADAFRNIIKHYKREHYQIAIDDFGKACSGIQRVIELQPQYVKIDMDLIRDINLSPDKLKIIDGISKFCKPLGIKLIAEGIETKEELSALIQLGIHYGQGYFIAKPKEKIESLSKELVDFIRTEYQLAQKHEYIPPFFGEIHSITHKRNTVSRFLC